MLSYLGQTAHSFADVCIPDQTWVEVEGGEGFEVCKHLGKDIVLGESKA